jgi:hypothetical protein
MSRDFPPKPSAVRRAAVLLGGGAVLLGLTVLRPGSGQPAEIIPAGSVLEVRVVRPVTSSTVALGDIIEGAVVSLQTSSGEAVLPPGTPVRLQCVAVRRAEGEMGVGYLRLTLTSLANSTGNLRSVETSAHSQWGEGNARGFVSARPGTRSEMLQEPAISRAARAPSGQGGEAMVTPEVSLTFVLLKPVVMDGFASSP